MGFTIADWLFNGAPLWLLTIFVFLLQLAALKIGRRIRLHRSAEAAPGKEEDHTKEGYIVSSILGLLALLLGFTFSLAVDRYDTRRTLVLQEANAIGTTYLRAQTFEEPHRSRLSNLLAQYVDNRLELGRTIGAEQTTKIHAAAGALHTQMWAVTMAAVKPARDDVSSAFMEAMNQIIDLAAARKAARHAHVPSQVFMALLFFMVISVGVLGYVLADSRRMSTLLFLSLLTISFLLIVDIDSPIRGTIVVSQEPLEDLKASIAAQPPAVFGGSTDP